MHLPVYCNNAVNLQGPPASGKTTLVQELCDGVMERVNNTITTTIQV
jgi:Ni2+-binding GTPase involved in maturation of urease and hydrogenase